LFAFTTPTVWETLAEVVITGNNKQIKKSTKVDFLSIPKLHFNGKSKKQESSRFAFVKKSHFGCPSCNTLRCMDGGSTGNSMSLCVTKK